MRKQKVLVAALGDCVHVAGLARFCHLAEETGYQAVFLGPAVEPQDLVTKIQEEQPDLVGVSYRLTPESGERVVRRLIEEVKAAGLERLRYWFGGTPPVAERVRALGFFEVVFDGREGDDAVLAHLRGRRLQGARERYPDRLVDRIAYQAPYPLIRHHYGEPSFARTLAGIRQLAENKVLDVISLGVDQNTQEHFFRPDEMDPLQHGAGGVPVRTPEEFRQLYEATRRGNYPLLRSYSGTRDLLPMARLLVDVIHLAWGAIPLTWYSRLDGRSQVPLAAHIAEAQETMRFLAAHDTPIEMNESHHWSLRDAPDSVAVAMAFLAAYNAKACGARHYVAQYMFNTPPGTSFKMDLAKMLAKAELIEALQDGQFTVFRETRTGLSSLPADIDVAKGHLASSVFLQMALRPQIVHVVAHVEADHAATADDVTEAVRIARGAIKNAIYGQPDMTLDPEVEARKQELISEARLLLEAVRQVADPHVADPWQDPVSLARAVHIGLIDAAHLRNNPEARGAVRVQLVGGACRAVDPSTGRVLSEAERIRRVLDQPGLRRHFGVAAG